MSAGHGALIDSKVAAIVLAGGRSLRFAPANKLLQAIDGEKMVRRVAALALASSARPVIAVTGFEAERVTEALHGLDVRLVHNPDFGEGLSASLRAGLRALPATVDGAIVLLGDMPLVELSVIEALLSAFPASDREAICVPARDGRKGNPVLWGRAYFAEMMGLTGDRGAGQLMQRHADRVIEVEAETDTIFEDVDLPSDLERWTSKLIKG